MCSELILLFNDSNVAIHFELKNTRKQKPEKKKKRKKKKKNRVDTILKGCFIQGSKLETEKSFNSLTTSDENS